MLGDDERDLGVVLLDIGGGTTDVAVFYEGSIRHTAIVPFGGANVTNDIAIGLRTPIDKAEAHQDPARLRAGLPGAEHGDDHRPGRGRPRRPGDRPARARLDDRAAHGGDLPARQQGGEEEPLRATCSAAGSSSRAAPRSCRAWSNWPSRCSRCPCGSAHPRDWGGSRPTSPIRASRPGWGWCSTPCRPRAARTAGANGGAWSRAARRSIRVGWFTAAFLLVSVIHVRSTHHRLNPTEEPPGAAVADGAAGPGKEKAQGVVPMFELEMDSSRLGQAQGHRSGRGRRQRGEPHDRRRACAAWSSSSRTPTCRP